MQVLPCDMLKITQTAPDDARGCCPLQVLIENGVDVNSADTDQRTALHVAASRGRAEVAFFLLNTPHVDINPLDRYTV